MIKRPPPKASLPVDPWAYIDENYKDKWLDYFLAFGAVDDKGRYLPYDEFRHRVPKEFDVDIAWSIVKKARQERGQTTFWMWGELGNFSFADTNLQQKVKTLVDQTATTAALEWTQKKLGEEHHLKYLLNDLIDDEAISSSQLEGAATTTLVAKDMLKRKREARSPDEKMIIGNFKMMQYAWKKRDKPLSIDFLKELHFIGVNDIDNNKYKPGEFRTSDDVVVADVDGNTLHQPPVAAELEDRLGELCAWINTTHDDIEGSDYIHSLIKAICIHFMLGYEHPFHDGNGRVARALFYWFMFKKDYGAFRYISVSNLLKKAAAQYGKSYLYTETDEMDLTYFIDYQCSIIMRAVSDFKAHCQTAINDIENFNKWLWSTGIYGKLSDKQKTVFQVAKSGLAKQFTATNVKENLGCSYNTAASVLNGLVALNLFEKQKDGKEWIYSLRDKKDIQKTWISS